MDMKKRTIMILTKIIMMMRVTTTMSRKIIMMTKGNHTKIEASC